MYVSHIPFTFSFTFRIVFSFHHRFSMIELCLFQSWLSGSTWPFRVNLSRILQN